MKEIEIHSKTFGEFIVFIDDEDYDLVSNYGWYIRKVGNNFYAYAHKPGGLKKIQMHRLIMGITDSNIFIDHKDRDGLNNQKSNLRIVDKSKNAANSYKRRNCTSPKYKGVSWSKVAKKWHGYINKENKRHYLGLFESEKEAAIAYNKKAIELFGEFAALNYV